MKPSTRMTIALQCLDRQDQIADALIRIACDPDITTRRACAEIARAKLEQLGVAIPSRDACLAAFARVHAAREKMRRDGDDAGDDDQEGGGDELTH